MSGARRVLLVATFRTDGRFDVSKGEAPHHVREGQAAEKFGNVIVGPPR